MAAALLSASVFALKFRKCKHIPEKSLLESISHRSLISDVFVRHHDSGDKESKFVARAKTSMAKEDAGFEVGCGLTFGDLLAFNVKLIEFACIEEDDELGSILRESAKEATSKTLDAFQLLMAGGRTFPKMKDSSPGVKDLHRKDELFNNILSWFQTEGLSFPKHTAESEGSYFVQVLCNCLWYLTNHHQTINDAAQRIGIVKQIPSAFDAFTGYNDLKRKKLKAQPLSSKQLDTHSQALYSLLLKPVVKSSEAWVSGFNKIKALADCMVSYKNHLDSKNADRKELDKLPYPVRTVSEHTTVEHRSTVSEIKEQYKLLDSAIQKANGKPIFVDESIHVPFQFQTNLQRLRFFEGLHLSVPVDIFRFCPGGSIVTSVCLVQVQEGRPEPQMLTDSARVALQLKEGGFKEFHSRTQRREFKKKLDRVAQVVPSVADLIYKELAMDRSVAEHPDTLERLRLIFLGEDGLLTDMRHLNTGRPSGYYDIFFQNLAEVVEEVSAADERRHNVAHMSEWISLPDLMERAVEKCPEKTPVPSKALVRLQFAPRNPYIKTAWNFTSKIEVQYKIQRRQLRASHPDQHYCACIFKYLREKAIELKDKAYLVCCDDKAKVKIGEPGFSVSTGVRGKKTLAPSTTTLVAGDHDMNNKASLTPSVILGVDIPERSDASFVRGQVTVIVNDSVLQVSTPFRHAVSVGKSIESSAKIIMKYSDGGVDHRNTLESVKCSTICLFKEYDLDMIILARCAPGNSWLNPAERVMSILNLGLQNCSLERESSSDDVESQLKSCGSMKEIRDKLDKSEKLKKGWIESVEKVQSKVRNRFLRLKLKEKPLRAMDPIPEEEIDIFQRHLRELFPDLDLKKLQKVHTKKNKSYQDWISRHCRERQYVFQVRKCLDTNCCLPPVNSSDNLKWLPDPVLEDNREHFKAYQQVKDTETSEEDRPSLAEKLPKHVIQAVPDTVDAEVVLDKCQSSMYTAQNARSTVTCTECRKPRVVYGKHKLSQRQQVQLASLISESDYTCGSPLTPPESSLQNKATARPGIFCNSPIELALYSSSLQCQKDLCTYCGASGAETDQLLKRKYKTVLPICQECLDQGKKPIVQRPYGKK